MPPIQPQGGGNGLRMGARGEEDTRPFLSREPQLQSGPKAGKSVEYPPPTLWFWLPGERQGRILRSKKQSGNTLERGNSHSYSTGQAPQRVRDTGGGQNICTGPAGLLGAGSQPPTHLSLLPRPPSGAAAPTRGNQSGGYMPMSAARQAQESPSLQRAQSPALLMHRWGLRGMDGVF